MAKKSKNFSVSKKFHNSHSVYILAFCLMLLPLDQLTFINGSASADSDNMVDYNLNQDVQNSPVITYDDVQKSLWRTNITPAEEQQEQVQKDELKSLVEQINAMELTLPLQSVEPADINEAVSTDEIEKNILQNEKSKPAEKNYNTDNAGCESISEQTIQKLKKIAEIPQEVDNPYEIGNTLYLSNCVGEAAAFYREALRRTKPDDMSSSDDRAWLMFQTGNSLRSIDMLAAADVYKKIITEYPDSPWADYARVQSNVITWYTKDKPDELLNEYKRK